jgi:flavin reductase (DIM6/NTAB) family NADH-FMN oxidoreductase RutF
LPGGKIRVSIKKHGNMIILENDIRQMEQRYRTAFINSLAGFRQAVLVGTKSLAGNNNLAIFNSLIHLGANPALYGLISRPDTVNRDTLQNILDTKEYTLNYIKTADYEKGHQTSARYDTHISEFEEVGFSAQFVEGFTAPFVKEAVVKILMKLEEKLDIAINGTILLVGSIQQVWLDDAIISADGYVELEKAAVLVSAGLDGYYKTKLLGRLSYAKPGKWPTAI